jgi:hypothetical protein
MNAMNAKNAYYAKNAMCVCVCVCVLPTMYPWLGRQGRHTAHHHEPSAIMTLRDNP